MDLGINEPNYETLQELGQVSAMVLEWVGKATVFVCCNYHCSVTLGE